MNQPPVEIWQRERRRAEKAHYSRRCRRILQLALVGPLISRGQERQPLPQQDFHKSEDIEVLAFYDRPCDRAREELSWRRSAQLQQRGLVVGLRTGTPGREVYNLAEEPGEPAYQPFLRLDDLRQLHADVWPEGGTLRIVRRGEHLDLCVGRLPATLHPSRRPRIMYRFRVEDFLGEDPRAVLAVGQVPSGNGTVDHGRVEPDTLLVRMRKRCQYQQARVENGRPSYIWRQARSIRVNHPDLPLLLQMQQRANDAVLLPPEQQPAVMVDRWGPAVMVAVPDDKARVLTSLAGWQYTPALQQRMLRELRRRNRITLPAAAGLVKDVSYTAGSSFLLLEYVDGQRQVLPLAEDIQLRDAGETYPLEAGTDVPTGCQIVVRGIQEMTWDVLEQVVGEGLPHYVQAFIDSIALREGGQTWLPWEIVQPVAEQPSSWKWDLRGLEAFWQDGYYLLPPIPLGPRDFSVQLSDLQVVLTRPVRQKSV